LFIPLMVVVVGIPLIVELVRMTCTSMPPSLVVVPILDDVILLLIVGMDVVVIAPSPVEVGVILVRGLFVGVQVTPFIVCGSVFVVEIMFTLLGVVVTA